jgi:hypothetical protein
MNEISLLLEKYEYYLNQGMVLLATEYKNRAVFLENRIENVGGFKRVEDGHLIRTVEE